MVTDEVKHETLKEGERIVAPMTEPSGKLFAMPSGRSRYLSPKTSSTTHSTHFQFHHPIHALQLAEFHAKPKSKSKRKKEKRLQAALESTVAEDGAKQESVHSLASGMIEVAVSSVDTPTPTLASFRNNWLPSRYRKKNSSTRKRRFNLQKPYSTKLQQDVKPEQLRS